MTDDLAAMARENDRLRQNVEAAQASFLRSCTRIHELEVELAEEKKLSSTFNILAVNHCLDKHEREAELTTALADNLLANMRVIELETERDGIRAKTIEDCARAAEDFQPNNLATWIAKHIRALKENP